MIDENKKTLKFANFNWSTAHPDGTAKPKAHSARGYDVTIIIGIKTILHCKQAAKLASTSSLEMRLGFDAITPEIVWQRLLALFHLTSFPSIH